MIGASAAAGRSWSEAAANFFFTVGNIVAYSRVASREQSRVTRHASQIIATAFLSFNCISVITIITTTQYHDIQQ